MKITKILSIAVLLATAISPIFAAGKINIVTSTSDLKDFAEAVCGDKASVVSIGKGNQDPHYIEIKPSSMMIIKKADVYIKVGMDLDQWYRNLVEGSRNSSVKVIDVSVRIKKMEVPTERVNPSMGDIHIYGNPHYWLSPLNAKVIVNEIRDSICEFYPEYEDYFKERAKIYNSEIDKRIKKWKEIMTPYEGSNIITYHETFPYFARDFKLNVVGTVEPKPGVPPSGSHVAKMIQVAKENNVKLVLVESFHDTKFAERIAQGCGAKVVVVPTSVGGVEQASNYVKLMDLIIERVSNALR